MKDIKLAILMTGIGAISEESSLYPALLVAMKKAFNINKLEQIVNLSVAAFESLSPEQQVLALVDLAVEALPEAVNAYGFSQ